jgi:hypothetical protein
MTRSLLAIPALVLALAACAEDRERPVAEPTAPLRSVTAPEAAAGSSNGSSVCRSLRRERAQLARDVANGHAEAAPDDAAIARSQEQVVALDALIRDACT